MRRGRIARRGRRGYALLTSMIMVSFLLMLGFAMFGLASTSIRMATRRRENAQALNLAMAGLDEGIASLRAGSFNGLSNRALGPGVIDVSVTTPAGSPNRRILTSTGTVTGSNHTVSRSVRCTLEMGGVAPVFYNAIAAKDELWVHGNVDVDSTPALNQGDLHSNNLLKENGAAATIKGDVTATVSLDVHPGATVTGTKQQGVPPMTFPDIDQSFKEQALAYGSQTGNLTVGNGGTVTGKINGSLTVSEDRRASVKGARISGVVWVTGNLVIEGPITGKGTIVVDGTITLDAKFDYPATTLQSILIATTSTATTAVDLGGNRSFKGVIYAPYGGVRQRGNATYTGAILANSIDLGGTPHVTRWTDWDDDPPAVPNIFQVKGWEEL